MKHLLLIISALALLLYSSLLLGLEFQQGQAAVRNYFDDIQGPKNFHAINTSLSCFFLAGTGLLFLVAFQLRATDTSLKESLFFLSQGAVFFYLAFDDRFLIHEQIGNRTGIGDHYVLLAVGIAELCLLATLGRDQVLKKTPAVCLFIAGAFFGLMTLIDGFVPNEMHMRLSAEDLLKTWSSFFLLVFAWTVLNQVVQVKAPPQESL